MKKAILYLENGMTFEALSFGASGTKVGEMIFNTSLTGYQEILTDPSYAGQFVNGNGYCSDARNVVSFIDLDTDSSNKWRSFRYEKLISWE